MKLNSKAKLLLIVSISILTCVLLWSNFQFKSSLGYLDIYILNVGQGDSILIKSPNNHWALIDAGRDDMAYQEVVNKLPILSKQLAFVLSSHPDLDHFGGIQHVQNYYFTKYLFLEEDINKSDLYDTFLETAKVDNSIEAFLISENDFTFDNLSFDIIWPQDTKSIQSLDSNDKSISLELIYKDFSFVTMGDLSKEFELEAIQDLKNTDIDFLKISHHGSKTSTSIELLESTKPEAAFISAGFNNSYGHPAKDVLNILEQFDTAIYRTDIQGTIHVQTDGDTFLRVRSENDNKWIEYEI